MNRLTATLVATTLMAAVAAIHYARAWQQLRGRDADPLQAVTTAAPLPAPQSGPLAGAEANMAAPATSVDPALPSEEAAIRVLGVGRDPVSLAVARHRLAGLRDPQQRAQRAREFVDLFLSGGWETVAPRIGMSHDELARFLEARVERMLQRNERLLECQLDAACDTDALRTAGNAAARRDEEELLGPDRYARFRAFQQASQDYQFAQQLNRRFPAASAMSAADISRLALALAEERQSFNTQARQDGMRSIGHVSGNFLVLGAAASAGAPDEYPRLRESASDYARRAASRAATVLTPAQFMQFKAVLDAELAVFQAWLRDQEAEMTLRRQARQGAAP